MCRVSRNLDDIYLSICKDLLHAPKVGNTRELTNVKLVLKDISNSIVGVREISLSYLFGEMVWYFTGRNETSFISKFSKFWANISDDGVTANSAYGYLMKYAFGFDQIEKVIEILKKDPNSRRAKININTPRKNVDTTLDEPCTMFLHFMIRHNKLHCTAVMRSNDIWYGLPYDVAFFTEVQKFIADKLGLAYGEYTHFACSLHMYDRDVERITKIVNAPSSVPVHFNRENFHKYCNVIGDAIDKPGAFWEDMNPRDYLMTLLKSYGIFRIDSEVQQ